MVLLIFFLLTLLKNILFIFCHMGIYQYRVQESVAVTVHFI